MKVAIFGVDQVSQIVAQIIEQVYNPPFGAKIRRKVRRGLIPDRGGGRRYLPMLAQLVIPRF